MGASRSPPSADAAGRVEPPTLRPPPRRHRRSTTEELKSSTVAALTVIGLMREYHEDCIRDPYERIEPLVLWMPVEETAYRAIYSYLERTFLKEHSPKKLEVPRGETFRRTEVQEKYEIQMEGSMYQIRFMGPRYGVVIEYIPPDRPSATPS